MPRSVKIAPEIDAKLYQELVSIAKENGQSQRFVLERALEHYLHNVVPSQRMVRPEVMAAYREHFRSSPQLAAAYGEEGWLFLQQGDLPRAQARLQQALDLNPQDVNSLINLGQVYETLQRPDRALALYDRALALSPNQLEVSRRIQILRSKGAILPKPD